MDALKMTEKRIRLLKQHIDVDSVTTMQSCVWNEMKMKNSEVKKFVADFKNDRLDRRLIMKQTFRGGLVSDTTSPFATLLPFF